MICLCCLHDAGGNCTSGGRFMWKILRSGAMIGCITLLGACTRGTPTMLPAIDLSQTREAPALVVEGKTPQGFEGPDGVVKGRVTGAVLGAGATFGAIFLGGANPATLIAAPIVLPVAVVGGAVKAHSVKDVEAAMAAFSEVGRDEALLTSLDRRFVEALGTYATRQWRCVEAVSASAEAPCAGRHAVARIELQPVFAIRPDGNFNPTIHFDGKVIAIVTVEDPESGMPPVRVLEARWAHRRELGSFFDLAADGGEPLRRKLELILDRFAVRIARDLYLAPSPQELREVKRRVYDPKNPQEGQIVTRIDPPDWNFVRMGQSGPGTGQHNTGTAGSVAGQSTPPEEPSPMIARVDVEAYLEDSGVRFKTDLMRYLERNGCSQPCRWNSLYVSSYKILQADGEHVALRLDYSFRGRVQISRSRVFLLDWRDGKLVFVSHREA